MESHKITTTNLSILRKILEGTYGERLENINHSNNNNNATTDGKLNSKRKRKSREPNESNFFLKGDNEFIADWLEQKRKLQREKRRALAKEKKKEKVKNNLEEKEKQDRLLLARESYDRWLIEIRKRSPSRQAKEPQTDRSANNAKLEAVARAYRAWLSGKQMRDRELIDREARDGRRRPPFQTTSSETAADIKKGDGLAEARPAGKLKPAVNSDRTRVPKPTTKIDFKSDGDNLHGDDDQLVQELRQARRLQRAQSLKRVDSALLRISREPSKDGSIIPVIQSSDSFQWKLAIPENSGTSDQQQRDKPSSANQYSRRLEQISHIHDNPFSETAIGSNVHKR